MRSAGSQLHRTYTHWKINPLRSAMYPALGAFVFLVAVCGAQDRKGGFVAISCAGMETGSAYIANTSMAMVPAATGIECSRSCLRTEGCFSFNFHYGNNSCSLMTEAEKNCNDMTPAPGSVFFQTTTPPIDCSNGYGYGQLLGFPSMNQAAAKSDYCTLETGGPLASINTAQGLNQFETCGGPAFTLCAVAWVGGEWRNGQWEWPGGEKVTDGFYKWETGGSDPNVAPPAGSECLVLVTDMADEQFGRVKPHTCTNNACSICQHY